MAGRGYDYGDSLFSRTPEQYQFQDAWANGLEKQAQEQYSLWGTTPNGIRAAAEVSYIAGLRAGKQQQSTDATAQPEGQMLAKRLVLHWVRDFREQDYEVGMHLMLDFANDDKRLLETLKDLQSGRVHLEVSVVETIGESQVQRQTFISRFDEVTVEETHPLNKS